MVKYSLKRSRRNFTKHRVQSSLVAFTREKNVALSNNVARSKKGTRCVNMHKTKRLHVVKIKHIRPPVKGGWIIYVTVVLSRPLTRVSPVLLRVNHPKWIRHTIYEYSQSSWTTLCKCLRLYWSSAILMHIINDLLSLYSVILINKQYPLFEN